MKKNILSITIILILNSCGQRGSSELVSLSSGGSANFLTSSSELSGISQELKSMSATNLSSLTNQDLFTFAESVLAKSGYVLQQPSNLVDYQVVLNLLLSLLSGLVQEFNQCALDLNNPDQAQCKTYLDRVEARIQELQNLGATTDCSSIMQSFLNSINNNNTQASAISCDVLFDYYRNTCIQNATGATNNPNPSNANSQYLCSDAAKACYTDAASRLNCQAPFPWQ